MPQLQMNLRNIICMKTRVKWFKYWNTLTLSWRRPLLYRRANQWTGFYMITTSVMKELNNWSYQCETFIIIDQFISFYIRKIWQKFHSDKIFHVWKPKTSVHSELVFLAISQNNELNLDVISFVLWFRSCHSWYWTMTFFNTQLHLH